VRGARRVCSSVMSRRRLSSQNAALVHMSRASASSAAPRSAACAPRSALRRSHPGSLMLVHAML